MAIIRNWDGRLREPSLTGRLIFDTYRGKPRVRSWPKKRGRKATKDQRTQREFFAWVQKTYPHIPPEQQNALIQTTKGTGLYPRDLFMKAVSGTMLPIEDENGRIVTGRQWRLEPVQWQGFLIRPTSNISHGTGAYNPISWPLPYSQTLPFWDAGAPTGITVPAGVEWMEFTFGAEFTAFVIDRVIAGFRKNTTDNYAVSAIGHSQGTRTMISTGAWNVAAGDFIEPMLLHDSNTLLAGNRGTFFTGTILQANP